VDLTTIELAYLHIVNLTKTFIERAKKMKGEADERMQKRREKGGWPLKQSIIHASYTFAQLK